MLDGGVNRHRVSYILHMSHGEADRAMKYQSATLGWSRFPENHMVIFNMEDFYSSSHVKYSAVLLEEGESSLAYKCHLESIDFEKILLILK